MSEIVFRIGAARPGVSSIVIFPASLTSLTPFASCVDAQPLLSEYPDVQVNCRKIVRVTVYYRMTAAEIEVKEAKGKK